MKYNAFIWVTCLLSLAWGIFPGNPAAKKMPVASKGYEIKIKARPFANSMVYLGHYFGEEFPIVDSAFIDAAGMGILSGSSLLPGGIYGIVHPGTAGSTINLLLSENQEFTLEVRIDKDGYITYETSDSEENTLLHQYENFTFDKQSEILKAQTQLQHAADREDSLHWIQETNRIEDSISRFNLAMIREYPTSFLAKLLTAMKQPAAPDSLAKPMNATDSLKLRNYLRSHYWDGVNFGDGRLSYTPFFGSKLDRYFEELVPKDEDSVIREMDWMLQDAKKSREMTHFLLKRWLYGSLQHYYKWGDPVFVHLYESFVVGKSYPWLTEEQRDELDEKAAFLTGKVNGTQAGNIILPDPSGKEIALYDIKAPYTLVCFWDPSCEHCTQILPQLQAKYLGEWKASGLQIFAVAVESQKTKANWIRFISDHGLQDWHHAYFTYQEEEPAPGRDANYLDLYDVWYFPSFYLLDKDKRFIASKLQYDQLLKVMDSIPARP